MDSFLRMVNAHSFCPPDRPVVRGPRIHLQPLHQLGRKRRLLHCISFFRHSQRVVLHSLLIRPAVCPRCSVSLLVLVLALTAAAFADLLPLVAALAVAASADMRWPLFPRWLSLLRWSIPLIRSLICAWTSRTCCVNIVCAFPTAASLHARCCPRPLGPTPAAILTVFRPGCSVGPHSRLHRRPLPCSLPSVHLLKLSLPLLIRLQSSGHTRPLPPLEMFDRRI